MNKKLQNALTQQKQQNEQVVPQITGILGLPLDGQRRVEVSGRNSYVYVRLRNNESEVIQAFNNQVAPAYNLPVLVEREGNRYIVIGVDTQRYENNWNSFAPFLPRHGNTHSFDLETGGGGDVVWVYPRQFTPLLTMPSGSSGGPNVIINPYMLHNSDGTWKYIGNTGTANIANYRPSSPTGAIIVLVYVDSVSGNPGLLVSSGTVFNSNITGVSQIAPYIPTITNPDWIPDSAIRLVTGTTIISWDNIYDVRQFLHPVPTGTGGGGLSSIAVQDEGIAKGNVATFNFVGNNVDVSVSGSVARVFVTGSSGSAFVGDANSVVLTDGAGALDTMPWLKWGTATEEFLEFGADESKEANAGKMGYNAFGDGYFDIIGAGPSGSTSRTVQIYDNLRVSNDIDSRFMNIAADGDYNRDGVPHVHIGTVMVQDEGIPIGTGTFLNFVGTNLDVTISGSTARIFSNSELLGYSSYLGGDKTTITGSMVDADAVNLAVTFTAPANARVLVRLTAQSCPATGAATAGNQHQWGLREGTTAIAGPHTVSRDVTANGFAVFVAASVAFVITGTTAGLHTYKWGHLSSAGGTVRIGASAPSGPAVMEVWSLP